MPAITYLKSVFTLQMDCEMPLIYTVGDNSGSVTIENSPQNFSVDAVTNVPITLSIQGTNILYLTLQMDDNNQPYLSIDNLDDWKEEDGNPDYKFSYLPEPNLSLNVRLSTGPDKEPSLAIIVVGTTDISGHRN